MAKMRVHELAKELEIKSVDIITALVEIGVEVKAASSIDDDKIAFIKDKFAKKGAAGQEQKALSEEKTPESKEEKTPEGKEEKTPEGGEAAKTEEKKEERTKPRVLITSKGIVRTGDERDR